MKLHGAITVNGRAYATGDEISWLAVYPFFMIHMLAFGAAGFAMAYGGAPLPFVYLHGGFAILIYVAFYLAIFGRDDVEWMFINAAIGVVGLISQINWILSLFGKSVADYPPQVHVIPVLYFVLYTFLLRHAALDLMGAREDETRRRRVQWGYVAFSVGLYLALHFVENGSLI